MVSYRSWLVVDFVMSCKVVEISTDLERGCILADSISDDS